MIRHRHLTSRLFVTLFATIAILAEGAGDSPAADEIKLRNVLRKKFPKDVQAIALEYTIILLRNGQQTPVSDPGSHKFSVGDQFIIKIEPKDDIYIYVLNEGPTGEKSLLQPAREELPPFAKAGQVLELPGDNEYFEFAEPAGEEKFFVVATTEPSQDLAARANAVFRKNGPLSAKEKLEQSRMKQITENRLISTANAKLKGAKSRGVLSNEQVSNFNEDLKRKLRGTIEEPPHGQEQSTFAMAVAQAGAPKPELLVTISLQSHRRSGNGN